MLQHLRNMLSAGWKEISTIDSAISLISWVAITLATFCSAIMADMARYEKTTVLLFGVSAFVLTMLLITSSLGWRKERSSAIHDVQEIAETAKISLLELRQMAVEKGWDFSDGSEQSLEFTLALSQAGLEVKIEFWGRKDLSDAEAENRNSIFQPIPGGHWLQFAVEPVVFVSATDNFYVRSYEFPSLEVKGYLDLHVNEEQAIHWLNTSAQESRNADLKQQQANQTETIKPN